MNFKKSMMIVGFVFNIAILQASHNPFDTNDSDNDSVDSQATELYNAPDSSASIDTIQMAAPVRTALTPERIAASLAAQRQMNLKDARKIKIGTVVALQAELRQFFIYGNAKHGKIYLSDFNTHYAESVDSFVMIAQASSSLPENKIDSIYRELESKPGCRDVYGYKVVGEVPSTTGFNDCLYNISNAKREILSLVAGYIDANKADVSAVCIGSGLQGTTSQEVWQPGCCDIQMHRSCFKQCKHNEVANCPNLFCQKVENGDSYPLNWTPAFYSKVLKKSPIVLSDNIRSVDCPMCLQPLKDGLIKRSHDSGVSASSKAIKLK